MFCPAIDSNRFESYPGVATVGLPLERHHVQINLWKRAFPYKHRENEGSIAFPTFRARRKPMNWNAEHPVCFISGQLMQDGSKKRALGIYTFAIFQSVLCPRFVNSPLSLHTYLGPLQGRLPRRVEPPSAELEKRRAPAARSRLARCLRNMRGDEVHERRRQAVVGFESNLLEPCPDLAHFGRVCAGLDDRGNEGCKLWGRPALLG